MTIRRWTWIDYFEDGTYEEVTTAEEELRRWYEAGDGGWCETFEDYVYYFTTVNDAKELK